MRVLVNVCSALVVALTWPGLASAQDGEAGEIEASAEAAPTEEASPGVFEAQRRVEAGEALFARGDFDAALVEFERAYEVIGDHPARYLALYNIAQCHERLFHYDRALAYYRRYLDEGGENAEDRSAVEATLRTLEGMLGHIEVTANVPASVWVDDRELGTSPGTFAVPGGTHVVELRAEGYEPYREQLTLPATTHAEVTASLQPLAEEFRGFDPIAFWLTFGGAALTGAVGGIFGGLALDARASIDTRLADPLDRYSVTEDDRNRIRALTGAADGLFVGAGVLAITATVLAVLTNWNGEESETQAARGFAPFASPNSAGVAFRGGF